MDTDVILKMSGATLGYVLVTAIIWLFWKKNEKQGLRAKILVGLVYGGAAVLANHFGISVGSILQLNVRDIGPLAAGLFFSPLSGIIAGTIGGAERILAGELWGIGKFTELACGMSTFLAGVIAALLNSKVFQGKRPPMTQAFFLGAVTEVFHMYAVLFTNRNSMSLAYFVVQTAAIPMIFFTAVGVALCSLTLSKISGAPLNSGWRTPTERVPITTLFQRALLAVIAGLFAFNFIVSYNLTSRMMIESIGTELALASALKKDIYSKTGNIEYLKRNVEEETTTDFIFLLVNRKTKEVSMNYWYAELDENLRLDKAMAMAEEHADQDAFRPDGEVINGLDAMCLVTSIGEDYYLFSLRETFSATNARDRQLYESTLSDILMFAVLYMLVAMLSERVVVRNLHRVNKSLHRITNGNLNETVWVHTSREFTDLSNDINKTVTALRGYISAAEQRMKDELKMAAAIQEAALPKNFNLPTRDVELYALMTPAREVGGDFYDFFYIGMDQLCLVIADVSGKGIPASLFMMQAKTAIKNNARRGSNPAELLEKVNGILCEGNSAEMFVTVWIGILNLKTGLMQCANAGHEFPVLMRCGGDYQLVKDKHGLVLAAMEGIHQKSYDVQLYPGDKLFVYTDGVPEAINEKEEAYGTGRLVERLNRMKNFEQQRILEDVLQDIRNFAGTAEQFDDITMMGIAYHPQENFPLEQDS